MNIAFDAKRAFHNSRGLGNYSRDTIRLLSTYYPKNNYKLLNPKNKNCVDFDIAENTSIITPKSIIGKAIPSLWRSIGVVNQLKTLQIDIYHGLSQELPYGIDKIGIKSVVTMHDAIFMRYPQLYSASYRAIFIQKNRYACRVADHIIAISEQTKKDIIQYFDADEKKISVVYQGCNNVFRKEISFTSKNEIREKYNLPKKFLLNVGAIEERKNAGLIIEALHKLNLQIPLVIVGKSTSYIDKLRSLIIQYKMEQQVLVIHNAETSDLPAIYSLADVFIYPSLFEGFGIPVLEALCVGVPVITSTGSCFEETGGEDTLYVNPHDALELGNAILKIISDNELRKDMILKGKIFAEKFTDVNIAHNMNELYLRLTKK